MFTYIDCHELAYANSNHWHVERLQALIEATGRWFVRERVVPATFGGGRPCLLYPAIQLWENSLRHRWKLSSLALHVFYMYLILVFSDPLSYSGHDCLFQRNKLRRFLPYRSCNSYWIFLQVVTVARFERCNSTRTATNWLDDFDFLFAIVFAFAKPCFVLTYCKTFMCSFFKNSRAGAHALMHIKFWWNHSTCQVVPCGQSWSYSSDLPGAEVRVLFPPMLLTHGLRDNVLGEAGSELRLWHLVRTEQANWLRVLLIWFTCKAGFARLLKSVKVQVLLWRTQKLRLRFCWNTWRHEGSPKFKAEETGREICSSALKVNDGLDITGWVL